MSKRQLQRSQRRASEREQAFLSRTAAILGLTEAAVRASLAEPRLHAVRCNPLLGRPVASIAAELMTLPATFTPLAWLPGCFVTADKAVVTNSVLFARGEVYVQATSSLIPGLVLAPQPGERLLDMCAAPGGKACHIASLTDNQAELWVNDSNPARLRKLRQVLALQGVHARGETQAEAQQLHRRLPVASFDRILLDAPCSADSHIDLSALRGGLPHWSLKRVKDHSKLQQQLLASAYQLLKPGGRLVYATCTMAPEENELPVDRLLATTDAELEPVHLPIDEAMPGLTSWQDRQFDERLVGALRIRPSHLMEAFFVAQLTKPRR